MYCSASATDWIRSSCLIETGVLEWNAGLLEAGVLAVTGCRWVADEVRYFRPRSGRGLAGCSVPQPRLSHRRPFVRPGRMTTETVFETHRPRLFGLAYK